jgi:hypothetical protein
MLNSGNTCYAAVAVHLIATLGDAVSVATHVASAADPEFTPRAADSAAQATQRAHRLAETRDATQRRANVFDELVSLLRDPSSAPSARRAKLAELRQFLFPDTRQQDAAGAVVSLLGRSEQCEGSLCSTVRCKACGAVSTTYDEFYTLELELPESGGGDLTLGACLERYTTAEAVVYTCPACEEAVGAEKGLSLAALPLGIVFTLKRFGYDRFAAKIGDHVALPLELPAADLRRLVAGNDVTVRPYRLHSVISHHGHSLETGHFTATCKSGAQWVTYDDHRVSVHDRPDDSDAYVALYVACGEAEEPGVQGGETAGERHASGRRRDRDSGTPHAADASVDTPMGEAAREANKGGVSWETPHRPPPGLSVVELQRLSSTEQIKDDFFHTDPETGRVVGRFMSPAEDEGSHGVNTTGWRTITASDGQTVVLQAQKAGGEQEVIGVLYGGTRARAVERALRARPACHPACVRDTVRSGACAHGRHGRWLVRRWAPDTAYLGAAG